ncbi:hypothetical protein ABZ946_34790 [Streptomyces sp. NPDC046324]|uniref:hypothetical protein n=1 Tax=Streptomyces sp. NPDC046324 TaxID=3154915 RepID=UPI0033F58F4D
MPLCSNLTIDKGWGPLLAAAFPSGHDRGVKLTAAQGRYLQALTDHDVCWRYTHLIASWFDNVSLPADRASIKALLAASQPRR